MARPTLQDWTGYGVTTVICGATVVGAVFLPWANESSGGAVNFSVSRPAHILGALQTTYGPPVLALGVGVIAAGVFMLAFRPTRAAIAMGLAVSVAGAVVAALAVRAGDTIWDPMRPGLGLYLEVLVGVILVPVGLASAAVGQFVRRRAKEPAAGIHASGTEYAPPADEETTRGEPDP